MRGHYQRISPKFTFLVQCFAIASYLADDQGSSVRKMAKKTRRLMGEKPSSCTTYMETVASTSGRLSLLKALAFFFYTFLGQSQTTVQDTLFEFQDPGSNDMYIF